MHSATLSDAGFVLLDSVPLAKSNGFGVHVYALVDPRMNDVRYVGVTSKSLVERLDAHLRSPTNRRTRAWFNELFAAGLEPEITRLQGANRHGWGIAEMQWIAWFRARGDLLNVDDGGMLEDSGTGLDDIKRAKAGLFMSTAKYAAEYQPLAPPPCAQDQRGLGSKRSDRRKSGKPRPRRFSQASLERRKSREAVMRVAAEELARQKEYERFGVGPRIFRKPR